MKKVAVIILTLALVFSAAAVLATADEAAPHITGLTPIAGGFKINFTACEEAAAYQVLEQTDSGWEERGTTADTVFACSNLTDGKAYTFAVKAVDESGKAIGDFEAEGYTQTYYNPPKLRSLSCTQAGMELHWNTIPTIDWYAVYRKSAGQPWALLALTDQSTFTDTAATSGNRYTYTVKGTAASGRNLTFHDTQGISDTFVAAPHITGVKNLADGTQITWSKSNGAGAYRVFLKSGGSWKKLADTTACTYTHKSLKNNTSYTYTVRCLNKAGAYISAFDSAGRTNTFYSVPKLISAVSAYGGMKVSWNAVAGVHEYLVFVKTSSGWKQLAVSATNSYLHKNAVSGKTYTYTVKCSKNAGKSAISWHNAKGVSGTYVAAPVITGFENQQSGVKIDIQQSAGAYQYRYFVHTASGWKAFATTKALCAVHTGVKNNTRYTYTVRALNKSGKYVSEFNPAGTANRFFAPPAFSAVKLAGTGNTLTWEENAYCDIYRVYKKNYGGSWVTLCNTDQTSFTDTTVKQNELYTYTLRYYNNAGKALSFYLNNTKFYYNGAVANGKIVIGGKTLNFTDGEILQGLVKRGGKYYFYNSTGFLQKNGIVGNSKTGYYYANKNGVIDFSVRAGIKYNNAQWLILNGKAKKVASEYDKTLYRAFQLLKECTNASMTNEQKLYASFRYLQKITTEMNPRIPHYTGNDWHLIYANDIFVNRKGNCMSYGAAFAFMAKAIGYNSVYACNSGGHGWAEVNGLVYDPEWDMHHSRSFYALSYDVNSGNDYKGAISAGYSWMRVKI